MYPPFFAITCFFFLQYFEELQTVLFEVELIFDNKPLSYVYPNTIETCSTPNQFLFGRQLLCSSNTMSTVLNRTCNHFLYRLRHGYKVNLRETQQISKLNINFLKINVNDIVLLFL